MVVYSPYRTLQRPSILKGGIFVYTNENLIDKTVEITVARMASCALDGKGVANFMQEVYNKLVELNKNN